MQVLDLCAGAGGKTLALAAGMQNTGQIYAYDADKKQLRPDLRAPEARRRAQRPGDGAATRRQLLGARAAFDLVLGRCALHGLGHLAPQARCQVAREAREHSRTAGEQRASFDLAAR